MVLELVTHLDSSSLSKSSDSRLFFTPRKELFFSRLAYGLALAYLPRFIDF